MELSKRSGFTTTPRSVLGFSVLLLVVAAIFGALNGQKARTLKSSLTDAEAARNVADQRHAADEQKIKARDAAMADAAAKATEAENKAAKAEAEMVQVLKDKTDLEAKLQANQTQIAALQQRVDEAAAKTTETNPGGASPAELQAQLDEARRLLDAAEREKAFLSDRLNNTQSRSTQLQQEVGQRRAERGENSARLGIRGTILAVNQVYNFVVLNLGGRQGVESNSEMLVLRGGTLIGKIRISSVEPSTAIGDIVTSSLARGVQVQPGDIVIYAGSNS